MVVRLDLAVKSGLFHGGQPIDVELCPNAARKMGVDLLDAIIVGYSKEQNILVVNDCDLGLIAINLNTVVAWTTMTDPLLN
jgi:hypothetical protein